MMLYGMSLVFGVTGATTLADDLASTSARNDAPALLTVGVFLTLVGFAFKVERGAVPLLGARHLRGRAHAGHRVPVGGVEGRRLRRAAHDHLLRLLRRREDSWEPSSGCSRRLSMTFGNLAALRQTNIVRMLAYSSIAQGGFMLVPLAVAADDAQGDSRVRGGRHLPAHLRRDEPRRVRRGHRGRPAHRLGRDLVVRRARHAPTRRSRSR